MGNNYTNEQLRRIDALVEEKIMGHDVEWRWFVVTRYGELSQAHNVHECLENPDPNNWKLVPCYKVKSIEWVICPHYTADHNAVAEMRGKLREMRQHMYWIDMLELQTGEYALSHDPFEDECDLDTEAVFNLINATPLQQCLAALAAVGVDVEQGPKEVEA